MGASVWLPGYQKCRKESLPGRRGRRSADAEPGRRRGRHIHISTGGQHRPPSPPRLCTSQQNYSYNWLPDFVGKIAFEPGYGHYEVFGLVRGFRDRVYPSATAANVGTAASGVGAFNSTTLAGGLGANARFAIVPKKLDLGFH